MSHLSSILSQTDSHRLNLDQLVLVNAAPLDDRLLVEHHERLHKNPLRDETDGRQFGDGSALSRSRSEKQRDAGEPGTAADVLIQFSIVHSPERLPEILELRRLADATGQANSWSPVDPSSPVDLSSPVPHDPRDENATYVVAEFSGQIIAAIRLGLPLPGPIMHHTAELSGPTDGLPSRHEFIEVARAGIHPDHRGQGLFWQLVAEMLKAARSFGRPFLVAGVEQRLWSFWRRCGFKRIGATYRRALSDAEYSVIVLNLQEVLAGHHIAPELAHHLHI